MIGLLRRRGEIIFVGLISIIIAIANIWHVILPALRSKPNTVFLGVGHHYEDYFFYLSQFAQGSRGAALATNQFTTEQIPQTMMWLTNVWLGKLGSTLSLAPWQSYNLSVFVFSIVYLLLIYKVMQILFPDSRFKRLGGFFLATVSTNFYSVNINNGQWTIQPFEFFYNYTAAFNRLGAVPHLILQNILNLWLLLLFSKIFNSKLRTNNYELITCGLAATWLFIINPVSLLLVGLACGLTYIFHLAVHKTAKLSDVIFFLALTILPTILFIIQYPALKHPFFQEFQIWEATMNPAPLKDVIRSFGPFILLIILGLPGFLKKPAPLRLTGSIFAILPLMLYFSPIPKLLHLPYFRFLQPTAYVFFGAMAITGINYIATLLHPPASLREALRAGCYIARKQFNNVTIQPHSVKATRGAAIQQFLTIVILIIILVTQLPMLHFELKNRMSNFIIPSPLNYVPNELVDGLRVLEKYPAGNVLSTNTLELLVPTFSGKTVYSAHRSLTLDYYRKIEEIYRFYHLQMSAQEARGWLEENKLTYILWHPEEGDAKLLETHYPYLQKSYAGKALIIYQM